MLIELSKATDIIRAEMKRVHHLYGASYTYVVLMKLLDLIEKIEGEPEEAAHTVQDSEMLERRKTLFSKLGYVIDSDNKGIMILHIMSLWKYIADVHGEEICLEVPKYVLDGEDEDE